MISTYLTDSPEALAAITSPEPKNISISGSFTTIATGSDYVAPQSPQLTVSAWQIRKALNATGLRALVEAAVLAGPQDLKDAWEYAKEFERANPLVEALGAALGKTSDELDDLFALAAGM